MVKSKKGMAFTCNYIVKAMVISNLYSCFNSLDDINKHNKTNILSYIVLDFFF